MVSSRLVPIIHSCLLVIIAIRASLVIEARTHPNDYAVLQSLGRLRVPAPPNWVGDDPCGKDLTGITCDVNSRVTEIKWSGMGLFGQLPQEIDGLAELQILDLSYNNGLRGNLPPSIGNLTKLTILNLVGCNFSGPIPDSIGSLTLLKHLSLNSNNFNGQIPASIGMLSNLYWLDIADNELEGGIPVSDGTKPGLDMLVQTKHFHFGSNKLSENIPAGLFTSSMTLIHLLLEDNQLSGSIPNTMGLVKSLEVVRLDNNLLTGPVPSNLNNLTNVYTLYLSNNSLNGSFPNFTGMSSLEYLTMENTRIQGEIPPAFFSLPNLRTVMMSHNNLNGELNISSHNDQLQLVDLQGNGITEFEDRSDFKFQLILTSNPICDEGGNRNKSYCITPKPPNDSYSTPPDNCSPAHCSSDQVSSPKCRCAYPYTGILYLRAPSYLESSKNYLGLEQNIMQSFHNFNLPVDSISLSSPRKNLESNLELTTQIFPVGLSRFNETGVVNIGFVLSNQTYKPPNDFGPYYFVGNRYEYFDVPPEGPNKSSSSVFIIGVAVAGSVLAVLLLLGGVYVFSRKRRAQTAAKRNDPFASWAPNKNTGGVPKVKGVASFSFEELKKYTNNFSEINDIGSGGYGKVYRGTLPNGQLVAIKRAQHGSMQGSLEFKTEIELLSRVHHKNVVSLLGFCFEQGEQMLVYEYVANGTLKDSLSGRSGVRLEWIRRLRIALGAARGLQYLHHLADPPIIHRDIKSNNILLDEHLDAKVADFGLSKPLEEFERSHVTTQVKGTMGYVDPEYYMTEQLTEKSDVYSFGVLLLELITARRPIEKGIHIVRVLRETMDKSKEYYNLHGILDPALGSSMPTKSLEKFVDVAMKCVEEAGFDRPSISEVVKEIETVMQLAGFHAGSASTSSTSASYDSHPFSYESLHGQGIIHSTTELLHK